MMNHLVTNYSLENHVIYLIKNFRVLSIEDYIYIYMLSYYVYMSLIIANFFDEYIFLK